MSKWLCWFSVQENKYACRNNGEPGNAIQGLHSNISRSEENGFVVFVPVDRLTLLKSTPGALYSIMSFVADMATSLNSLRFFSHIYSQIDNSAARGSVWQAFAQAVGSYVSEIEKQLTRFEKYVQENCTGAIEQNLLMLCIQY